ncbi:hypothetical protein EVAR_75246_1 [Eumeta japonica]|uniref:Uncharacterized protein n=1 Tax=Eumeta variegata TaxID=151549 RepID=A0A4C1V888_EUMVA|nr:hypothetical protein EVAR_75246_1 [Eumeta japonica]
MKISILEFTHICLIPIQLATAPIHSQKNQAKHPPRSASAHVDTRVDGRGKPVAVYSAINFQPSKAAELDYRHLAALLRFGPYNLKVEMAMGDGSRKGLQIYNYRCPVELPQFGPYDRKIGGAMGVEG